MAITYEPLASITLSSSSLLVTFSSISNGYTDLRLVSSMNDASGSTVMYNFNGDGLSGARSTKYSSIRLLGNGSSASSANYNNDTYIYGGVSAYTSGIYNLQILDIFSYTSAFYKTVLLQSYDQNAGQTRMISGQWKDTSAITSVTVSTDSGSSFIAGTTLTLYGILKA